MPFRLSDSRGPAGTCKDHMEFTEMTYSPFLSEQCSSSYSTWSGKVGIIRLQGYGLCHSTEAKSRCSRTDRLKQTLGDIQLRFQQCETSYVTLLVYSRIEGEKDIDLRFLVIFAFNG